MMPAADMDTDCQGTLDDEPGGGKRFHLMLASLAHLSDQFDRKSIRRLVDLYQQLCTLQSNLSISRENGSDCAKASSQQVSPLRLPACQPLSSAAGA